MLLRRVFELQHELMQGLDGEIYVDNKRALPEKPGGFSGRVSLYIVVVRNIILSANGNFAPH